MANNYICSVQIWVAHNISMGREIEYLVYAQYGTHSTPTYGREGIRRYAIENEWKLLFVCESVCVHGIDNGGGGGVGES